jgi:hypothetical protein
VALVLQLVSTALLQVVIARVVCILRRSSRVDGPRHIHIDNRVFEVRRTDQLGGLLVEERHSVDRVARQLLVSMHLGSLLV